MPAKLRPLLLLVLLPFSAMCSYAADKLVRLNTVPPGATVEINGSVTCTTPCSITVPKYYFGDKHTVFAKHAIEPIIARFSKQGYLSRELSLTVGPIRWTNLNGVHVYDYYLVTQTAFNVELQPETQFFPAPTPTAAPKPLPAAAVSTVSSTTPALSTEQIVRQSMPAVVVVSTEQGWGSGFFISSQGVVVTNAHVVGDAQSVKVSLSDGRTFESGAIFKDQDKDLALIKLPGSGFPFLRLATAPPGPGADVIAIGSPGIGNLALTDTVTKGVVSAVRQLGGETWIQTDAAINHGNSGGPLLNASGDVVGVNTLIANKAEYSGLNFSISSDELSHLVGAQFGVNLDEAVTTAPESSLSIASVPAGADIQIDGVFIGTTPSEIPVQAGDHHIIIAENGYKTYERTIRVLAGAKQSISAELERSSN